MKRVISMVMGLLLSYSMSGNAMESDLEARLHEETNHYIAEIEAQRGPELIRVADLITGSGLNNAKLYSAVEKKANALFEAHRNNPKDKHLARELNAVMRTLGATGPQSRDIINDILDNSSSWGVRSRANRLISKLPWFNKRNELMQKPGFYQPGQDLMTHRFLNLVTSNDFRMRRWGTEEISRRRGAEAVVYQKLAETLEKERRAIESDLHLDSLAWFCRILREFDAANSADLLSSIYSDPNTHKKLKKHSKVR